MPFRVTELAAGAMRFWTIIALVAAYWLAAGGATGSATAAERSVVSAVRIGAHGDSTRFVAELSAKTTARLSNLAQPSRLLITLPTARFAASIERAGGEGLVTSVRYQSAAAAAQAQIVLNTRTPVRVSNMFTLPPTSANSTYRLVIDMVPADAVAPAGTVLAAHRGSKPTLAASVRRALHAPPPRGSGPSVLKPVLVAGVGSAADALQPPEPLRAPRSVKPKKPLVAIDAGHGGVDPGAIGRGGEYEKTIVLAVAKALKKELEATGRFRVLLTRDSDVFIPLGKRVTIARKAGADLFLSIHADTISDRGMRGAGVYTLSAEASDSQAAALAAKENRSDLIAGVDLSDQSDEITSILIDFAQHHTQERSTRFAEILVPKIRQAIPVRQRTHRSAGFRVLKAVDVPSALVELGYISNPEDEKILTSASGQRSLARALSGSIEEYFGAES